jgi:hypothetical protein
MSSSELTVSSLSPPFSMKTACKNYQGSGAAREMENISRGPTFGDFVTILTERSMQDVMVERSRVIFMAIAITRKIVYGTIKFI